jgi:hypothetical protein
MLTTATGGSNGHLPSENETNSYTFKPLVLENRRWNGYLENPRHASSNVGKKLLPSQMFAIRGQALHEFKTYAPG